MRNSWSLFKITNCHAEKHQTGSINIFARLFGAAAGVASTSAWTPFQWLVAPLPRRSDLSRELKELTIGRLRTRSANSRLKRPRIHWISMESYDDDLKNFEAHGAAPLPVTSDQGYVDHDGARIWYATYGVRLSCDPAAWWPRP